MQEINEKFRCEGHEIFTDFNAYMIKVFLWMFGGLFLSFAVAIITANSSFLLGILFSSRYIFFGLLIFEFALVLTLSSKIKKFSYKVNASLFILYSFVNGLTLSIIFLSFNSNAISVTFFSTAILFGIMALLGRYTSVDLGEYSGILLMLLIGLVLASLINIFLLDNVFSLIISIFGVLIFSGITAYDVHIIKDYYYRYNDTDLANNYVIIAALQLYLDFINMFIYLLRIISKFKGDD